MKLSLFTLLIILSWSSFACKSSTTIRLHPDSVNPSRMVGTTSTESLDLKIEKDQSGYFINFPLSQQSLSPMIQKVRSGEVWNPVLVLKDSSGVEIGRETFSLSTLSQAFYPVRIQKTLENNSKISTYWELVVIVPTWSGVCQGSECSSVQDYLLQDIRTREDSCKNSNDCRGILQNSIQNWNMSQADKVAIDLTIQELNIITLPTYYTVQSSVGVREIPVEDIPEVEVPAPTQKKKNPRLKMPTPRG